MEKNKFIKGRIVVITNGLSRGNPVGSIVKILAKPGELSDEAMKTSGITKSDAMKDYVLCEALKNYSFTHSMHCNNKRAFYQNLHYMRLANADEKIAYSKGIRHTHQVEYSLW